MGKEKRKPAKKNVLKKDKRKGTRGKPADKMRTTEGGESTLIYTILIIDNDDHDWDSTFADIPRVRVDQCEWHQMLVQSDSASPRPVISIKPNRNPKPGSGREMGRTVSPDFVIVRKLVRGLTEREDYTNALYGLYFSGIPAINSIHSIVLCLERAVVHRALLDIQKRLRHSPVEAGTDTKGSGAAKESSGKGEVEEAPKTKKFEGKKGKDRETRGEEEGKVRPSPKDGEGADRFPVIPMTFHSHYSTMRFTPAYPFVAKIGSAEAGYGKMRFLDERMGYEDFRTAIALHHEYCTLEPYIEDREYDLRIQRIGSHVRAYKRINPNWKGNVGSCLLEEIDPAPYRAWTDEVAGLFGGLDIFTVDAIHTTSGKEFILEINDTASGFAPSNQVEDMAHVRDLALAKMREHGMSL